MTATDQYGCTSTAQVNVQFNEVPQLELPTYLSGCGSVIIDPNYYVGDFLWSTGE
ncbi:hypothetical protein HHU12_33160, partial [Flammeovirga aprica JL-4]|nr:hypothetical protein [Flammeovirga aprica JL-4]